MRLSFVPTWLVSFVIPPVAGSSGGADRDLVGADGTA